MTTKTTKATEVEVTKEQLKKFKKDRKTFLMTTRFNNTTLKENRTYLQKKKILNVFIAHNIKSQLIFH